MITRPQLTLALCAIFIFSLVYSPFLLSMSMIGLLFVSILDWQRAEGRLKIKLNLSIKLIINTLQYNPAYLSVTLCFFLVLLSGWQTEDWSYWFSRLRIKLPFLLLPLVFVNLPAFSKRQYLGLVYFLLLLLLVTCLGVGINYLLHFEKITNSLEHGKSIPVPCNHIRFSLILVLGVIGGGWLWWERYAYRYNWERLLIGFTTLFLISFIFLLSVRSGLLALYSGLFILLIYYIHSTRRYWKAAMMTSAMAFAPVTAYFFLPSFNAKMDYMQEDLEMHQKGKGEHYSDSGRLTSIEVGLDIGNEHPLLGVGAGNLKQEVEEAYEAEHPESIEPKMPHNQWVHTYAGTGIFGVILFTFAFFYPLLHHGFFKKPVFLAFNSVIFSSFLTESTIENALGVGIYAFFLLLGLHYMQQHHD